jgi:hypothetical protein
MATDRGREKMRALLSTTALLISLSSAANAGPKEEAFQVVEKWTKALLASDLAVRAT